jgi:putative lipoprotein
MARSRHVETLMRALVLFSSLAGLVVAGCASSDRGQAPASSTPAPVLPSEVVVMPQLPAYVCPNGRLIEIEENPTTGTLRLRDGSADMMAFSAVGKDRKAFVSGEVTIEYDAATLRFTAGNQMGMVCMRRPAEPAEGRVWGTIDKRDRMAIVPGTRARVMLLDVSRADAPSVELARTEIVTVGNQMPLNWLIAFDPALRQPRHTYTLRAIVDGPDGAMAYTTDTFVPVPSEGPIKAPIELVLVPVRQ